jgi:hypothetical protein
MGQVGNGVAGATPVTTPEPVIGGHTFVEVSAGSAHTCAIRTDGAAWCWGGNASGGLGDGTLVNRSSPVPVLGGLQFSQIGAGIVSAAQAPHSAGDRSSGRMLGLDCRFSDISRVVASATDWRPTRSSGAGIRTR